VNQWGRTPMILEEKKDEKTFERDGEKKKEERSYGD
jgi:hypothetical protein